MVEEEQIQDFKHCQVRFQEVLEIHQVLFQHQLPEDMVVLQDRLVLVGKEEEDLLSVVEAVVVEEEGDLDILETLVVLAALAEQVDLEVLDMVQTQEILDFQEILVLVQILATLDHLVMMELMELQVPQEIPQMVVLVKQQIQLI